MQKKLIALAVAGLVAAPAFAQSNVTMYGRLDYGYLNSSTDMKIGGVKSSEDLTSTGFGTGALTTSRLGFKGSEDLGNGLKAFFQLELQIADTSAFGTDTGANLGDSFDTRLSLVGLSGAFGSVALGRQYTAVETAWGIGAAGAINNAVGALYTSGMKQNNTRSDELITYTSPAMSGVKVAVQYGKGETDTTATATDASQKEMGFSATYGNGPLNVSLGYSKESGEAAGADTNNAKQIVLGANYDFGVVKLFGTYMNGSNDDAGIDKVKGWELGLNAPVGPVVLVASYYDGKTETTANVDADRNGYQLGVLYPLSKRTIVYGLYGNDEADINSANNSETTQVAIGLRHDF